ncbi:cyclopropane-fatty-acyl-phospholipid synthase [Clostridium carboxidivorans P7]|uniref:Cyclopropane-fatty-acyl-phospholipid synthase n=2 Tax=Clostridium carboxidivorans P7 TaxID=536227 RepID=C6PVW3_9CLOT|nr:class I SAM-dependent methyltransferase [Clostridium carboxidivorans]AKN32789.1 cyclopropane-fatty-acyl-phospholipid synthase [Clostridium carboxidivorans P7]EET86594.1 cyclopropane-fatty-acyl-phospholipid synthase [Clostridium carboxidivorans P7]EFG89971.1 RNA cap guanine-N2 methyltransferase [Clostridium carboxidivorans P7]
MDSLVFEKMWNECERKNLSISKKFWDLRAEEFNKIINNNDKEENMELVKFLTSKHILNKDSSILDVGCGVGKHSLQFSKYAKNIIGIDISSKMIEYAIQNMKDMSIDNIEYKVETWQSLNLDDYNWRKKFDLVFASMTPAINSKDTLLKMIEASKRYCFMSGFVYRNDNIKNQLREKILGKDKSYNKKFENNIYYAFNILWNMGIHAEIQYKSVQWNKEWDLSKAIEVYTLQFEDLGIENSKDIIKSYLESISDNGKIKDSVNAKVAWMLWKKDE